MTHPFPNAKMTVSKNLLVKCQVNTEITELFQYFLRKKLTIKVLNTSANGSFNTDVSLCSRMMNQDTSVYVDVQALSSPVSDIKEMGGNKE